MLRAFCRARSGLVALLAASPLLLAEQASGQVPEADIARLVGALKGGDNAAALEALDATSRAIWSRTALAFTKAVVVKDRGVRHGEQQPRDNAVFPPTGEINVYTEFIGYGWRPDGRLFALDVTGKAEILAPDGRTVGVIDYGKLMLKTPSRSRDGSLTFSGAFKDLPEGGYKFRIVLDDAVTGKSAETTVAFVVRK